MHASKSLRKSPALVLICNLAQSHIGPRHAFKCSKQCKALSYKIHMAIIEAILGINTTNRLYTH